MELAIEAGAEDFISENEGYEILTDPAHFETVHKAVEARGIRCEAAAVVPLPSLTVSLDAPSASAISRLVDTLEDHDDVKEVYSTAGALETHPS